MPPRRIWLLGVAIVGAELLSRLVPGVQAPEVLLYPVVLLLAYHRGLAGGVAGALLAAAYLAFLLWQSEPAPPVPDSRAWRVGLFSVVGMAAAAVGHLRDRVDRALGGERVARESARAASQRAERIVESIADGFVMLDRSWRFTYVNRAAQALLRLPADQILGRSARAVLPRSVFGDFLRKYRQSAAQRSSIRFEASLSSDTWVEVHAGPSPDGVALYFRDTTERRQHEEKLRSMTLVDELTGLYNRRGFFALAEQQRKLAERKNRSLLLVFADLDDLKRINDTFGHSSGDQALFEAAAVLRHTFRETDVVARIGGDEFAALVLESEPGTAPRMLQRLENNVRLANAEGTLPFDLSLSFGAAGFDPASAQPIDELLSLADHRMYEQKRAKRRPPGPSLTPAP